MKILIITDGFYPEISARSLRATELAKELARQGHAVKVISRERVFDVKAFEKEFKLKYQSFGRLKLREIKLKGGNLEFFIRKVIRRLFIQLFEYPSIEIMYRVKKVIRDHEYVDLLVSVAFPYPIHWGVAWARTHRNLIAKTWIADCGDPYMGDRTDTFSKPFYFKYLEKWFCRKADYISIPIREAKAAYYEEFWPKIKVIPQGFDFNNIIKADYIKNSDYPVFAFAGSLTMYIDSAPRFFEFLTTLNLNFKFIMFTESIGWAKQYMEKLDGKVEVRNYVDREQLIYELSKMDFLVNFMYKTHVQRSSKLINYALTGRPILNIDSETEIDSITLEFFRGDYKRQYKLDNLEDYNIKNVAEKFIEITELAHSTG